MSMCRLPCFGRKFLKQLFLRRNLHTSYAARISYIYNITVSTGDAFGAGTDSNVYIRLIGEKGSSDEIRLQTIKSHMERGMVNSYKISAEEDVGALKKIIVRHDNTGFAPAWLLEKVEVLDNRGRSYQFDCHTWLVKDGATNPIVLLKTEDSTQQKRTWEKKVVEEEISIDDGLKQVVQSIVGIDDIFQEALNDAEDEVHTIEEPIFDTPSEISLSARHATSLSPAVRFLVDTYGLDFFKVDGTGRHGRVLKSDIMKYMSENDITEKRPKPAEPVKKGKIPEKVLEVVEKTESLSIENNYDHVTSQIYQSPHLNFSSRCIATNMKTCAAAMEVNYQKFSHALIICQGFLRSLERPNITLDTINILINNYDGKKIFLKGLCEENLRDIFEDQSHEDFLQDSISHNISINIVKEDGVIEMSPVLLDGEMLNVTYSDYLPILDVETKQFVPTCMITLTCDSRYINETIAVSILESLKKYVQHPADLLL